MKVIVNDINNFCRVFQLPSEFPEGFCFGGGLPTTFQMVDWFNPIPAFDDEFNFLLPKTLEGAELEASREMLKDFIRGKGYFNPLATFLIITDYGDAFLVGKGAA